MKDKLRSAFTMRQYMESKDFEIYFYNDLNFKTVEPHKHDYYEFYFPVAGEIEMEIEHASYPIDFNQIILVPPGVRHRAVCLNPNVPYQRFIFWLSKKYVDDMNKLDPSITYIIRQAQDNKQYNFLFRDDEISMIRALILKLLEEIHSSHYGKEITIYLYIVELILTLSRMAHAHQKTNDQQSFDDPFHKTLNYIDAHLDEELSLDELSDNVYVSKYHLAHLFKENLGISAHQYILHKRLKVCADEIIAGESITKVCSNNGFTDYSSFYRAFKKEYSLSPKEFHDLYVNDSDKYKKPE